MDGPVSEQLDIESLLRGKVTGTKSMPNTPKLPVLPSRGASTAVSIPAALGDMELIEDDTSSWSDSDEGGETGDRVAQSEQQVLDEEELDDTKQQRDEAVKESLMDPLGILGELTVNLKTYNASYDPASIKFDATALLSNVHYATSYDKLKNALDALKNEHASQKGGKGLILGSGMIESNNFNRFVATNETVEIFCQGVERQGLSGTGTWTADMITKIKKSRRQLDSVLHEVTERREQIRTYNRVVRFARKYRTVLKLPDTLRGLISSPAGYGQAAREYRKAQRVLRGASGPVFRHVLAELEDVAARWKASLYGVLGTEFLGESYPSDDHVVEAVRALRELASTPEPALYFAQQQMIFTQLRIVQRPTLAEAEKVLPALRLAFSKLGAASPEAAAQASVWANVMEICCDGIKGTAGDNNIQSLLQGTQKFWERVGDCVGSKDKQTCHLVVSSLVQWLKHRVALQVTQNGVRECGVERFNAGSRSFGTEEVIARALATTKNLVSVVGDAAASDVGVACLCKGVDVIVQACDVAAAAPVTTPEDGISFVLIEPGSAEDVLLMCAVRARRLMNDGLAAVQATASAAACASFTDLCKKAVQRALRKYFERTSHALTHIICQGVKAEFSSGLVKAKGLVEEIVFSPPASASSIAAPTPEPKVSAIATWAFEVLEYLMMVMVHLDSRVPEETSNVLDSLSEVVFFVLEDFVILNGETVSKEMMQRITYNMYILSVLLQCKKFQSLVPPFFKRLGLGKPNVTEDVARNVVLRSAFTREKTE